MKARITILFVIVFIILLAITQNIEGFSAFSVINNANNNSNSGGGGGGSSIVTYIVVGVIGGGLFLGFLYRFLTSKSSQNNNI